VTKAAGLRDAHKFQEGREALAPFLEDNDYDVFDEMGRNIAASTGNPNDKIASIAWFDKAIALKPKKKGAYAHRAGAYGDAGWRYVDKRLADRQKVVELAEAAASDGNASGGEYSDLAGAHNSFITPRGGGAKDMNRVAETMKWRSKAIAVDEKSYGRHLDRAELVNSHLKEPSDGWDDVDRALYLVKLMDGGKPASWYARAQLGRRLGALSTAMSLAGAKLTVNGISTQFRPSQAQFRNKAIDNYKKYIDGWEASGRDFAKFGSALDALNNLASTYRALGGVYHREALKAMQTLIELQPENPDRYWNYAISLDALDERGSANSYYQSYLDLNGGEDTGNVGAARARLAQA
jgi:hypothetical protein